MTDTQLPPPATDPVCGMAINRDVATAQGLVSEHDGETYLFCGRGCKLNFEEHPARYLDPGHVPSM
ncbi:MAG TPA: YHS domain-containing protein [Candidatus Limnocylindria bacterium]